MTNAASGAGSDQEPARARSESPTPADASTSAGQPTGRLWLIRHGETEWSRAGRHTSHTDLPLTQYGERQATALRRMLGRLRPALVLSSPRTRALRTAQLAGLLDRAVATAVDDDLAEWDYGEYEGRTSPEIQAIRPGWTIWADAAPQGESAGAVAARADRVLARARTALPDGDVVAVGHGHLSRVLAARWLGRPAADGGMFALGPAAPCVLGWEHHRPAVIHWNLVSQTDQTDTEVP